jgi:hypothetical protein
MLTVRVQGSWETGSLLALVPSMLMVSWMKGRFLVTCNITCDVLSSLINFELSGYRFNMSVEEAGELARRAIYGATFRDAASGGCVSGMFLSTSSCLFSFCGIFCHHS